MPHHIGTIVAGDAVAIELRVAAAIMVAAVGSDHVERKHLLVLEIAGEVEIGDGVVVYWFV